MDNINYMNQWKRGDYILSHYKIIGISREHENSKIPNSTNIILADITPMNISSSFIREKIVAKKLEEVKPYLKKEVLEYIQQKGLYEENV